MVFYIGIWPDHKGLIVSPEQLSIAQGYAGKRKIND